jgi:hypothetical protein
MQSIKTAQFKARLFTNEPAKAVNDIGGVIRDLIDQSVPFFDEVGESDEISDCEQVCECELGSGKSDQFDELSYDGKLDGEFHEEHMGDGKDPRKPFA